MATLDESVKEKTAVSTNPLPEDIGQIVDLIYKLKASPSSKRLFLELYNKSRIMILEGGSIVNLVRRKKTYSYVSKDKDITFYAEAHVPKNTNQRFRTIDYNNSREGVYLKVVLEAQLAALTSGVDVPLSAMGRVDKVGLMDLFLKGYRVYRGISYVPRKLIINDGKSKTEHSYSLPTGAILLS